ncbi:hypothetical protein C5167_045950 [Papaver somniferum]|uniref:IP5PC-F beta-propeller domain-containing protein n=1 Tax=Papaver somniferum TaxID=3469 RepID=A0A4Y7LFU2_PAPSO|nr:hypothetical protein C5167_045950 [Papaver somniferum]
MDMDDTLIIPLTNTEGDTWSGSEGDMVKVWPWEPTENCAKQLQMNLNFDIRCNILTNGSES